MMVEKYQKCAELIKEADVLIITAGAGIGVDSGLPDFRGDKGFWKAYPMYERLGLNFVQCANPVHFESDPSFGWGFYGHRLEMYRNTTPHKGFYIMLDWIDKFGLDYFVVTSNVDGQFQKAGYKEDKIYEIHGSIHHLQCVKPCTMAIWENTEHIEIDYETMRAKNIPRCKFCGDVARPNILMFGDYSWIADRSHRQSVLFDNFLEEHKNSKIVVIEIGAGTAIPSIRYTSERIGRYHNATVIRINPREPHINKPHISIPEGGLKALSEINKHI
ncbi:transcriptional regulator, Sir2 family [Deferribacter desulfuricans SSM1]|uniref:protein acetyllysine N-acetyltransferase n=1 Tax=Deferribacter desulfuricans (strain DSM 14783 / JCM 11476 / NBRC 101012 / SSM1) TaxID=639282 RepID=D3PE74_DEFDS|nr:Sir2 family NAD-dependent protein deacetylase [Deferribacter desulfuricans]BAI80897.1 transcriptional regulator, Sir2 family [Deferribacter desulfuricans SSM1]